ncbi:MAG: anti-sigma factor [Pararhodobacter sp.]|nr:anti-sigma factor [Pararhodobacter sp.]
MSDPTLPPDAGPEEHDELLAAEYVLGTLPGEDRRAARERAEVDGAFAARISAWEDRLAPLNDGYDEAPAPDLLPQIEARLFGARTPAPRLRWFSLGWRGGALATAAIAAVVFLAVTLWPPGPAPVVLRADLTAEQIELRFAARWDGAAGLLELTRAQGDAAPAGQDYELWLIDETGVPRSLGLLRDPVTQVRAVLAPGLTLAVSLEPEGGSPEATPTGPVLAAAALDEA